MIGQSQARISLARLYLRSYSSPTATCLFRLQIPFVISFIAILLDYSGEIDRTSLPIFSFEIYSILSVMSSKRCHFEHYVHPSKLPNTPNNPDANSSIHGGNTLEAPDLVFFPQQGRLYVTLLCWAATSKTEPGKLPSL